VQHQEIGVSEAAFDKATGRIDMAALEAAITPETACVVIGSPNFFGVIEDVAAVAELVHAKGALLVVSINEALSLGIVKAPSEADIVILEAQSFGVAVGYGGPYCGVLACKEKFLRQMPGRLCGETKDADGKRGFVLTLSTREQHIRREKATSNICTNQALVSLMVTIYMTVMGKQGLKELAEQNLAKAAYLKASLEKSGARKLFSGPSFNEFAVALPSSAEAANEKLLGKKIIGGLSLAKWYPELGENASLWCATELTTKTQMDAVSESL
jgi:glycine dehydrogenase subunit 1